MARRDLHDFVVPLSQKLAEQMGLEFVDAELAKESAGQYLRIYLDKKGGISLEDCERFHREIQPKLEPVPYDFLEISSPGLDRPLKTDKDFERTLEKEIEVRLYRPVDGKKAYHGLLKGYDADSFRIAVQDEEKVFVRRDVAVIKPVIVFDADEVDEGED